MIPSSPNRFTTPYGSSSTNYPTNNSTLLSREKCFANDSNSAEQMRMEHLKQERLRATKEVNKGKLQDRQRRLHTDQEEIKHIEIEIYRLTAESARLNRELAEVNKKISEIDALEKKSQGEHKVVSSDINQVKSKLTLTEKKSSEDINKLNQAKLESQRLSNLVAELNARIGVAKRELELKQRQSAGEDTAERTGVNLVRTLEKELSVVKKELDSKKVELALDEAKVKRDLEIIRALEIKVTNSEKEIGDTKRKERESESKIQHSKIEIKKTEDHIRTLELELAKVISEFETKNKDLGEINKEVQKDSSAHAGDQSLLIEKKKISEQREFEIKKRESEKAFRMRDLENKKRAINEVETKRKNLEIQLQQLKRDAEAMQSEVKGFSSLAR